MPVVEPPHSQLPLPPRIQLRDEKALCPAGQSPPPCGGGVIVIGATRGRLRGVLGKHGITLEASSNFAGPAAGFASKPI